MTTKKITLSTIKSFIKKNSGKLYINVTSKFDGMVDGCVSKAGGFTLVNTTEQHLENTLGVFGAWFVGQSRDYFTAYEDAEFVGYKVSNSCGTFILAFNKAERLAESAPVEVKEGSDIIFNKGAGTFVGIVTEVREKAIKVDYAIEPPVLTNGVVVYVYTTWMPKSVLKREKHPLGGETIGVKSWFANKFEGGKGIRKYFIEGGRKVFV